MAVIRPDDRWNITLPDGTNLDITNDVQQYRIRYGGELGNDPRGPRLTPSRGRLQVWDPDRRYDPTFHSAVITTTRELPITLTADGTTLWSGFAAVGENVELQVGTPITFTLTDTHQAALTSSQSYRELGSHTSTELWDAALTAFGVPFTTPEIFASALGPVIFTSGSPLKFVAEFASYIGGWAYASPSGDLGAISWNAARTLAAPDAPIRALSDSIVRRRAEWVLTRGLLVANTLTTGSHTTLHSSTVTLAAGDSIELEYEHFAPFVISVTWAAPVVTGSATATEVDSGPLTQTVQVDATSAGTYTVQFLGAVTSIAVSEIQRPVKPDAETQFTTSRWEPPPWWTRNTFSVGDSWLVEFGTTPPLSMSLNLSRWARTTAEQAAVSSLIPGAVRTVEVPEIRKMLVLGLEYQQRSRSAPTVLVHGVAIEGPVTEIARWDVAEWDTDEWR